VRLPMDNPNAPLYTVGQVAAMLDVQPAFVRRLDTEELVSPRRSDGGQRRYSRAEILQVQRVSELADEGLTLAGIRRLILLEAEVTKLRAEVKRLKADKSRQAPPNHQGNAATLGTGVVDLEA
jgi:MerR family transcriptional regulator, heat shock protein HspR